MNVYKVLGQEALAAATLTDVYVVPVGAQAVVSSVMVCNRDPVATTYRLSVAVGGAADSPEQYIAYDVTIDGNDTYDFTIGATLFAGDVLRAYAGAATVSVNVFGEQLS